MTCPTPTVIHRARSNFVIVFNSTISCSQSETTTGRIVKGLVEMIYDVNVARDEGAWIVDVPAVQRVTRALISRGPM